MQLTPSPEDRVRHGLALLHYNARPNVELIFLRLAESRLYDDLVEFLNKWTEALFDKCLAGVEKVIERFHDRVATDPSQATRHDLRAFLQSLRKVLSEKMLDGILSFLFSYPVDRTFLEGMEIERVDAFLRDRCPLQLQRLTLDASMNVPPMSPDQIKATTLIAERCHRRGEHLKAALVYTQLACRRERQDEALELDDRIKILDRKAQSLFLNVGSMSALKVWEHYVRGLELQKAILRELGPVEDAWTKQLKHEAMTARQMFTLVTTHPRLQASLEWREKLLEWVETSGGM